MTRQISLLFMLFADWCGKNGHADLSKRSGAFKAEIGEFEIYLNPHKEEIEANDIRIPPFTLAIFANGWPLGFADPYGGALMSGAEGTVIDALRAAGAECEESAQ